MKNFYSILLLIFFSLNSYAQFGGADEIDSCKKNNPSQDDYVCGQCEDADVKAFFGDDMGPVSDDPANEGNRKAIIKQRF